MYTLLDNNIVLSARTSFSRMIDAAYNGYIYILFIITDHNRMGKNLIRILYYVYSEP